MEDKTTEPKSPSAIPKGSAVIAILCMGCVVLGLLLIYVVSNTTCDGIALALNKIYESSDTDLYVDFTELIKANTEILEDCTVINFTQASQSDVDKWLRKRDIEKFNVSYKCDILTFDSEIYKQGNKYYLLSPSLGPCGKENVYYIDSAEISVSEWFKTKYFFEWQVINRNLKNHDFCVNLENKIYGERRAHCR